MSLSGIKITKCRLCNSSNLKSVIDFGSIPLGNDLKFSLKKAINSKEFPLIVNNCNSCGHFQLSFSVNKEILYQDDYSYLSSIGKKFVKHLEWSSEDIFSQQNIKNRNPENLFIIDIGSNDGTALTFFKNKGCKVLGVDPSDLPVKEAQKKEIKTINQFFNYSLSQKIKVNEGEADIVISHNVLAHVENLKDIFTGIFNLLKDHGVFVFEIGYFASMIRENIYDTIYHEHLDYHTLIPIVKFLNSIGFNVFNADIVNSQGGSLRIYCSKSKEIRNKEKMNNLFASELLLLEEHKIENWKNGIFSTAKKINSVIKEVKSNDGNLYGYGAPTKSTLACKIIDIKSNDIVEILEDNMIKVGRYTPTLGIPIVSKFNSKLSEKDLIICFAWNFIEAIIEKIRDQYGKKIKIISTKDGKVYET